MLKLETTDLHSAFLSSSHAQLFNGFRVHKTHCTVTHSILFQYDSPLLAICIIIRCNTYLLKPICGHYNLSLITVRPVLSNLPIVLPSMDVYEELESMAVNAADECGVGIRAI